MQDTGKPGKASDQAKKPARRGEKEQGPGNYSQISYETQPGKLTSSTASENMARGEDKRRKKTGTHQQAAKTR